MRDQASRTKAMRTRSVGLLVVALVLASCGSPTSTPSASSSSAFLASPTPTVAVSATPSTAVTPTAVTPPPATATPAAAGRWESAAAMALGRGFPRAVLLGDGRVLVVGNAEEGVVRADSVRSEIRDPASGTWSAGPSLDKPRDQFVALAMADGRVFLTGGVSAGVTSEGGGQDHHQSFSSSFVFDPKRPSSGWSRVALQDHARTAPAAATLLDGRVLVAGGYYLSGATGLVGPAVSTVFAAYRLDPSGLLSRAHLADVAPPTLVPALATAELYDPATNTWSATGPLHFARVGASAVTLADGRILVVGSTLTRTFSWNYREPQVSERAYETAETYDPRTGRFSLTADLPAVDWSPLATLGPYPITPGGVTNVGTLVPLADGGALLVGRVTSWFIPALGLSGSTARTLRFDPTTQRWAQVDQTIDASFYEGDTEHRSEIVSGHAREGALAVRLRDGRVLVAGGQGVTVSSSTEIYDPATGDWAAQPSLPEPRMFGVAVLLADGSALLVGGRGASPLCDACTGVSTALRFVPGP